MRPSRFQQFLSGLFLVAVLLIAANAWLAFHAEAILENSEHWVTHTLEVITDLERVLQNIAEAESSVRGFMLTGREPYLARYLAAQQSLPAQFELLEHLVSDNHAQVSSMRLAAALVQQKMDYLGYAVSIRRDQNKGAIGHVLGNGKGEAYMREVDKIMREAEQSERTLLVQRLSDSAEARFEAKFTVALASTLDILFVIFSLYSLEYERNLRQRAAEGTRRLEKLQSVTDVGFTQLTVPELTTQLLGRLREATDVEALVLCRWFHEDAGDQIEPTASEGNAVVMPGRRRVVPGGALWQAAHTGEPMHLERSPNAALEPGTNNQLDPGILPDTLHSLLIVPLRASSRIIGMLVAGRSRDSTFSPADEELLRLAADRIALALDRAAAYDAERAARHLAERHAQENADLNAVLEERVLLRTAELENTNRELEAFSYSVSHDLRAPLRSIDGFSVALEEDYGPLLQGDGLHYLGRVRAGVQRMGQLIDALLQLSRITRADLSREQVDLSGIAFSVAQDIALSLPNRPLDFHIEPGLEVEGDARLLRVIFENMFGNAAKFTANVAQPEIHFGWSPEEAAYYIRDNGAGFDQQYAGKLFVAFQRLHGEKDFQGSGIGLATVARVIARHHGTIRAQGVVSQGATFWFTLG
ncbi:CHASE3 domain-containing protein [Acidipila sp. EB88]|uniref:sensor histidine kinase n=1 Tax=Acidipila sp. EB88 TaxID=2305226 RepID=UPI00131541D4|nr:CHASE3 domain-containing protein [Acidipila sp. EB88]